MPRSVVILNDPATGIPYKYEGVTLEYLLRGHGVTHEFGTLEVSYGRHQKLTALDIPIDPNPEPLVADTVDGKSLIEYVPLPERYQAIRSEMGRDGKVTTQSTTQILNRELLSEGVSRGGWSSRIDRERLTKKIQKLRSVGSHENEAC